MGISKTEINLRRLVSAAPHQQNQSKLVHYVATLREQLEQLSEEKTPQGLPRVTKAKVNEYYEKIEAFASKIAAQVDSTSESSPKIEEDTHSPTSPQLRRRIVSTSSEEQSGDADPIKLDTAAQAHIENQRKFQENLTDEMVVLARQLKESSLMISHSVQNTEKVRCFLTKHSIVITIIINNGIIEECSCIVFHWLHWYKHIFGWCSLTKDSRLY
ncbi:uncharacterized protein LOC18010421 isoform X3 [Eutrema salsugineum]|uniref:uncharacterized protein LOC18010421 isoform X3 n=1 Tax=Eutrema salsugineum TaxID=72664 RepID=UPI000CED7BAD|nr:uncharacterized protein LOC18010421 isoform X3 [Eutrema salsugineum]